MVHRLDYFLKLRANYSTLKKFDQQKERNKVLKWSLVTMNNINKVEL